MLPILRRARLCRELLTCALLAALLLPAQAEAPSWWAQRGVLQSTAADDDYAALNQGQLKNLVRAAADEMEARLTGGAGPILNGMVSAWRANTAGAEDYAAVKLGQLKAAAKPVYQRLLAANVITALPAWATAGATDDDYATANIGQAKNPCTLGGFILLDTRQCGRGGLQVAFDDC